MEMTGVQLRRRRRRLTAAVVTPRAAPVGRQDAAGGDRDRVGQARAQALRPMPAARSARRRTTTASSPPASTVVSRIGAERRGAEPERAGRQQLDIAAAEQPEPERQRAEGEDRHRRGRGRAPPSARSPPPTRAAAIRTSPSSARAIEIRFGIRRLQRGRSRPRRRRARSRRWQERAPCGTSRCLAAAKRCRPEADYRGERLTEGNRRSTSVRSTLALKPLAKFNLNDMLTPRGQARGDQQWPECTRGTDSLRQA